MQEKPHVEFGFGRFRLPSLIVILFAAFLAAGPAVAQDAGGGAKPTPELSAEKAKALADALRDPATREALLQALENVGTSAETVSGETDVAGAADNAETEVRTGGGQRSFGRRIAELTSATVESVVDRLTVFAAQLSNAPRALSWVQGDAATVVVDALIELAIIIAVTVALFITLRRIAKRFDRRLGYKADLAGFGRTAVLIVGSVIVDASVVVVSWAIGYAVATLAIGEFGQIGIRQSLYLNAFLIVELIKVALRAVLSPNTSGLRPVDLPDKGAKTLYLWLNVAISILGYGQMLIVPIVSQQVSWLAGQGVGLIVSALAVMVMIALVVSSRKRVASWLLSARHMQMGPALLRFAARNWHVPVLAYLGVLFLIVVARPGDVLLPVIGASMQILAAIVVGAIAISAISRSIRAGVRLPSDVNQRLPLLERRLNAFVPVALTIVRIVIFVAVMLFSLHTVDVIDLHGWLVGQVGAQVTGTIVSVLLVLLGAFAVWLAFSSWIDFRLNPDFGTVPSARERTLLTLARNALSIIVFAVTTMFVLSEIGIDIAPLIASAGVIGLAIGFGAQKLVQDIITGVFIQFENAMNVGDVVSVGGVTGTVERLTIRSVSLRDIHGAFHIIPFSSVDMVTNNMRGFGHYVCDMGVAYREDVEKAKQAMFDAFEELRGMDQWKAAIMEDMTWFGVQSFAADAVVLRSRIKCMPGQQWGVGRAYNAILKRIFDERGIEIPFPHRTLYFGEDTKGEAPPMRIQIVREPRQAPPKPAPLADDASDATDISREPGTVVSNPS